MNLPDTTNPPFDHTSSFHSPRSASSIKRKRKSQAKRTISPSTQPAKPSRPITYEEIWEARTAAAKRAGVGAWTNQQLAQWGVPNPPGKGWIERLISTSHEPQVCGPHCHTETVLNAALSVIMKFSGMSKDEALDTFVVEFLASR